ncbi:hypothetical protein [Actinomadura miaoliensis]
MAVTDQEVAVLRAHLARDFEEYERLWPQLDRGAAARGYTALIAAAFFEAVDRRFSGQLNKADVVEYVGEVRARFDEQGTEIDPLAAEVMIRAALGDEVDADLDDETVISTQLFVLTALVLDEELDGAALDEFLAEARKTADHWLSQPS